MLQRLRIENLAVVEDVALDLGPGLNVVTGSTGAGKSLIVGAVNLLLGERASPDTIRAGFDEARVEAVFAPVDVSFHPDIASHITPGRPLTLARRINRAGRSHASVDGRAIPLKDLRTIGSELIEPHGQNEQYRLRDPMRHVEYVDAFAGNATERAVYVDALAAWRRARGALERYDSDMAALREKRELYAHRLEEIDRVAPKPGEKSALDGTARMLANAEKIYGVLDAMCSELYDDDRSASSLVGESERRLASITSLDPRLAAIAAQLAEARAIVSDATSNAREILAGLDFEPADIERLQERLEILTRLERRYQASIDALIEQRADWARSLVEIDDGGARRAELVASVSSAATSLAAAGFSVSRTREVAAAKLDRAVTRELQRLTMRGARFRTDIRRAPAERAGIDIDGVAVEPLDNGFDIVRLRVQSNPGEAEGDLDAIASTGELSRVALVLKELTAAGSTGATMIFDEIDAGVGADLGEALAEKLLALAENHQIICITHMPQIAARGHLHLVVAKEIEGDRTRVRVRPAEGEERTREIARMLGGEAGSDRRLALADEMLDRRGRRVRP
jgi:DNA repair protein RecN (Recombination protein N)